MTFVPLRRTRSVTGSVMNMASLWVGMVVCVPTYMLAAGLIEQGMSWGQAVATVMLGNVIVLVLMILNGHPGTKYGVPFPVMSRAAFGIHGAHIPSLLRALVACGWFGIQTWIGGAAIYQLLGVINGGPIGGDPIGFLGINAAEFLCFLAFWGIQVAILWRGVESIRVLETYAAPFLIAMGLALLVWAYVKAGGFGTMLSTPSQFAEGGPKEGQFWSVFFPSLTAMVGFWATLSLNIPDFTRYAKSQRDQVLGQAIGLPTTMTLFAFIGVAVTSATTVIFGEPIWDPTVLLGKMGGGFTVVISLFALSVATPTNIAANVVSPANAMIVAAPQKVTFRMRRDDHRGYRCGHHAVEAHCLHRRLHLHLAHRLLGAARPNRRHSHRRLLPAAEDRVRPERALPKGRSVLVQRRLQPPPPSSRSSWRLSSPTSPASAKAAGFVDEVAPIWSDIYTYAWFVGFFIAGGLYLALMGMKKEAHA